MVIEVEFETFQCLKNRVVRAMKYNSLLSKIVVCSVVGLISSPSHEQKLQPRTLTAEQLDTLVKTDINSCTAPAASSNALKSGVTDPALIIPTANSQYFPHERVAKTLNGVWIGTVIGDTGEVGVDYFWIIDSARNEALIIAQRSGRQSVVQVRNAAVPSKISYLMCAHDGYFPSKDTPQLHEFTKVSDSIAEAPKIIQRATGLKLKDEKPTLTDLWNGLVAIGYFDDGRFSDDHGRAYAGALFKPIEIEPVKSVVGPAGLSVKWNAEYRGGGATSLKFKNNVPILGVEYAQFVGTSANSGDYLVSSPGNGRLWKVEASVGAQYDLAFDKVSIGPLSH